MKLILLTSRAACVIWAAAAAARDTQGFGAQTSGSGMLAVFTLVRGGRSQSDFESFVNSRHCLQILPSWIEYDDIAFHEGNVGFGMQQVLRQQLPRLQFVDAREYGGFRAKARALLSERPGGQEYSLGYRHMVSTSSLSTATIMPCRICDAEVAIACFSVTSCRWSGSMLCVATSSQCASTRTFVSAGCQLTPSWLHFPLIVRLCHMKKIAPRIRFPDCRLLTDGCCTTADAY
eukprot:577894-Prymnesium_polylepis.1